MQGLTINNDAADEFIVNNEKEYIVNFNDILQILDDPKIILKNTDCLSIFQAC